MDFDILTRNISMILVALQYPPEVARDIILHIWYSAFITPDMLSKVQDAVLFVVNNIQKLMQDQRNDQETVSHFTYGTRKIDFFMEYGRWKALAACIKGYHGLNFMGATKARQTVLGDESVKDPFEFRLHVQPGAWRVATMKFRNDGMLLPFGASRDGFTVPNP